MFTTRLRTICKMWLMLLAYHGHVYAQHVVRTDSELRALLIEDKEQGIILLDGDLFQIADLDVKAGGIVKPFPGRKPVLIGFHQRVSRGNRSIDRDGYWTVPIKTYGYKQIVFLDKNLDPIPFSCHINGVNGFEIREEQIKIIDRLERLVAIPIPHGFESLKNKDRSYYKNFSIKLGYWFVGINLREIYSDNEYLFGIIDNTYNFDLLSKRPDSIVRIEFFNLPKAGDGIFIDGDDVLNVPFEYDVVRVCTTPPIVNLVGNRDITFDSIIFTGANTDAIIVEGSNKHISNCVIRNCGRGIVALSSPYSNCSVENCLIENLYNNVAVNLTNIDDVTIINNTTKHTGTLMKGGSVISVGGLNFIVRNNIVTDFSYNGISVGNTREYRPGTVSGVISDNIVDNHSNYGDSTKQLDDGGGIYVITHTDGVDISNNIVRNIGYENAEMHGIYLDDGAYNVTVRNNLIYNINHNSKAIFARFVKDIEYSCMNNVFENNICIGNCLMSGNQRGLGGKTIIKNNFISGVLNKQDDAFVKSTDNHFITAEVQEDGRIKMVKKSGIKKIHYSRKIRNLIQL